MVLSVLLINCQAVKNPKYSDQACRGLCIAYQSCMQAKFSVLNTIIKNIGRKKRFDCLSYPSGCNCYLYGK